MQARVSKRLRKWIPYSRRYKDHVAIADAFLRRVGAQHGDSIHRLVERTICSRRLPRREEEDALSKYHKTQNPEDLAKIVSTLGWVAMRPILQKPIYDEIFEDVFQASMESIHKYLCASKDRRPEDSMNSLGYIVSNTRRFMLDDLSFPVSIPRTRGLKKVRDRLESCISESELPSSRECWQDFLSRNPDLLDGEAVLLPELVSVEISHPDYSSVVAPSYEENIAETLDFRRLLSEAEKVLAEREMEVIKRRLLTEEPQSYTDIGEYFGVSGERIRQVEREAISALKEVWLKILEADRLREVEANYQRTAEPCDDTDHFNIEDTSAPNARVRSSRNWRYARTRHNASMVNPPTWVAEVPEATHKAQIGNCTMYLRVDSQSKNAWLLKGSLLSDRWPSPRTPLGYRLSFLAIRIEPGLTAACGELLSLTSDVKVSSISTALAAATGYGGFHIARWEDRDGREEPPEHWRAIAFPTGIHVDLPMLRRDLEPLLHELAQC